ncbi:MAG: hypothetical protein FI687_03060 [SAR202 cluster bacterium]|nr:hypothetical protein [SAR202 cluster bacterium]|tara:strand:+ start:53 stop:259 length:207 start_codon:yes stop_codon:yes gene_type:complete
MGCEEKKRFKTKKMVEKFIYEFNKDPLIKEKLVSYWCQRHQVWHVSKESNKRPPKWFEILDRLKNIQK